MGKKEDFKKDIEIKESIEKYKEQQEKVNRAFERRTAGSRKYSTISVNREDER